MRLLAEPDNPHDRYAVGVWDGSGEIQVGYVPKSDARRVSSALAKDAVKSAFVISQFRGMATGERSGIRVLTSPTDTVRFADATCGDSASCTDDDIPF
ncbi:MAG: HIRAN domain-containing protein [Actinomycetota bacterium]|nr:HIRAN domain-containing protein [Actinomycetota bacterium]